MAKKEKKSKKSKEEKVDIEVESSDSSEDDGDESLFSEDDSEDDDNESSSSSESEPVEKKKKSKSPVPKAKKSTPAKKTKEKDDIDEITNDYIKPTKMKLAPPSMPVSGNSTNILKSLFSRGKIGKIIEKGFTKFTDAERESLRTRVANMVEQKQNQQVVDIFIKWRKVIDDCEVKSQIQKETKELIKKLSSLDIDRVDLTLAAAYISDSFRSQIGKYISKIRRDDRDATINAEEKKKNLSEWQEKISKHSFAYSFRSEVFTKICFSDQLIDYFIPPESFNKIFNWSENDEKDSKQIKQIFEQELKLLSSVFGFDDSELDDKKILDNVKRRIRVLLLKKMIEEKLNISSFEIGDLSKDTSVALKKYIGEFGPKRIRTLNYIRNEIENEFNFKSQNLLGENGLNNYFSHPAVSSELNAIYERYFASTFQNSRFNDNFVKSSASIFTYLYGEFKKKETESNTFKNIQNIIGNLPNLNSDDIFGVTISQGIKNLLLLAKSERDDCYSSVFTTYSKLMWDNCILPLLDFANGSKSKLDFSTIEVDYEKDIKLKNVWDNFNIFYKSASNLKAIIHKTICLELIKIIAKLKLGGHAFIPSFHSIEKVSFWLSDTYSYVDLNSISSPIFDLNKFRQYEIDHNSVYDSIFSEQMLMRRSFKAYFELFTAKILPNPMVFNIITDKFMRAVLGQNLNLYSFYFYPNRMIKSISSSLSEVGCLIAKGTMENKTDLNEEVLLKQIFSPKYMKHNADILTEYSDDSLVQLFKGVSDFNIENIERFDNVPDQLSKIDSNHRMNSYSTWKMSAGSIGIFSNSDFEQKISTYGKMVASFYASKFFIFVNKILKSLLFKKEKFEFYHYINSDVESYFIEYFPNIDMLNSLSRKLNQGFSNFNIYNDFLKSKLKSKYASFLLDSFTNGMQSGEPKCFESALMDTLISVSKSDFNDHTELLPLDGVLFFKKHLSIVKEDSDSNQTFFISKNSLKTVYAVSRDVFTGAIPHAFVTYNMNVYPDDNIFLYKPQLVTTPIFGGEKIIHPIEYQPFPKIGNAVHFNFKKAFAQRPNHWFKNVEKQKKATSTKVQKQIESQSLWITHFMEIIAIGQQSPTSQIPIPIGKNKTVLFGDFNSCNTIFNGRIPYLEVVYCILKSIIESFIVFQKYNAKKEAMIMIRLNNLKNLSSIPENVILYILRNYFDFGIFIHQDILGGDGDLFENQMGERFDYDYIITEFKEIRQVLTADPIKNSYHSIPFDPTDIYVMRPMPFKGELNRIIQYFMLHFFETQATLVSLLEETGYKSFYSNEAGKVIESSDEEDDVKDKIQTELNTKSRSVIPTLFEFLMADMETKTSAIHNVGFVNDDQVFTANSSDFQIDRFVPNSEKKKGSDPLVRKKTLLTEKTHKGSLKDNLNGFIKFFPEVKPKFESHRYYEKTVESKVFRFYPSILEDVPVSFFAPLIISPDQQRELSKNEQEEEKERQQQYQEIYAVIQLFDKMSAISHIDTSIETRKEGLPFTEQIRHKVETKGQRQILDNIGKPNFKISGIPLMLWNQINKFEKEMLKQFAQHLFNQFIVDSSVESTEYEGYVAKLWKKYQISTSKSSLTKYHLISLPLLGSELFDYFWIKEPNIYLSYPFSTIEENGDFHKSETSWLKKATYYLDDDPTDKITLVRGFADPKRKDVRKKYYNNSKLLKSLSGIINFASKMVGKIADDLFEPHLPYLNLFLLIAKTRKELSFFTYYRLEDLEKIASEWILYIEPTKKEDVDKIALEKFRKIVMNSQVVNEFAKITKVEIGKSKNSALSPSLRKLFQMTKFQQNYDKFRKQYKDLTSALTNAIVLSKRNFKIQDLATTLTIIPAPSPSPFSDHGVNWDRPYSSVSDVKITTTSNIDKPVNKIVGDITRKTLFDFATSCGTIKKYFKRITLEDKIQTSNLKWKTSKKFRKPDYDDFEIDELKEIFGVSSAVKKDYGRIHNCSMNSLYPNKITSNDKGKSSFASLKLFFEGPFSQKIHYINDNQVSPEDLISTFLPIYKMENWIDKNYSSEFKFLFPNEQ